MSKRTRSAAAWIAAFLVALAASWLMARIVGWPFDWRSIAGLALGFAVMVPVYALIDRRAHEESHDRTRARHPGRRPRTHPERNPMSKPDLRTKKGVSDAIMALWEQMAPDEQRAIGLQRAADLRQWSAGEAAKELRFYSMHGLRAKLAKAKRLLILRQT